MASLRRTSTVYESSSTLTSNIEQQIFEPTENEAFIPKEVPALPRLEGEIAYPPAGPKDHGARKALLPNDARVESIASMLGGLAAGVTLAVSHHIFLALLNGRNIDEYPQYWIKNANNAFSALFSTCIAFVATCALIQIKWKVARTKPLSIFSIDNLFALPSPGALFTSVTSTRLRSLRLFLPPILAALFIQSVALVSVFAPNALTVAPSAEISRDIVVPTLDLSKGPITSVSLMAPQYTTVSQSWTTLLTSIMLEPPIFRWKIPLGCGARCKFELVYEGPGLQCADNPLESPAYIGPHPPVYNATSTLYPNPRANMSLWWEIEDQYKLRIGYRGPGNYGYQIGSDGGNAYCVFRNATYNASFQVENNTMQVNHTITSYGDILGTVKYGDSDLQCSQNFTAPCFINGVNTRAMCEVFASAFAGIIQFNLSDPAQEITGGINAAVVDLLFSHDSEYIAVGFQLAVPDLNVGLVRLFSDLVLGFTPHHNDTTIVQAEIWDGTYAWSYTVWILWAVYLPTLILTSLVILNGLLSLESNERGVDDKFSSFLLTTRNTELDNICMEAADFEELQQLRLLYHREKGTFSVASSGLYPK